MEQRQCALSSLKEDNNKIAMDVLVTELPEVKISVPREAVILVKETLRRKGENYLDRSHCYDCFLPGNH